MKSKRLTKFISAAVAAGLFLTTGITAFAAERNNSLGSAVNSENNFTGMEETSVKRGPCKGVGKGGKLTSILAEMVKEGTLTQSEADKITAYIKERQEALKAEKDKVKNMTEEERKAYFSAKKADSQNLLAELVSKNIITQAKADAIKAKMEQRAKEMKAERLNQIKSQLNTLVAKGTINQSQVDKVLEYINQRKDKVRKEKIRLDDGEKEKIKNMTEEERKAYFEKIRGERVNFLKELVDNGTLTQEQADAIFKAIRPQHEKGMKGN